MKKIIELDDRFPRTGEPTMVVLAREGRAGWLVEGAREKYASDAFEYIKTVAPKPGYTIVLVNALGTYEYYDINRNGDGFNERPYRMGQPALCGHPKCNPSKNDGWVNRDEIVTQHYKTFERGGIYKHHCFPAGTLVTRSDRTRVPIETIEVGNLVATTQGDKPVTGLFRRHYTGEGVAFQLRGQLDQLIATKDHPLLVLKRPALHCRHGYNRLSESPHTTYCAEYRSSVPKPEWVPASDVLPGDYLLLQPPSHGVEKIKAAFAALVGWVASEGHLGANGTIQFCFAEDNYADIHSVKRCFAALGKKVRVTPRPQYGVTMLTVCSTKLHTELSRYVTGVLSEKHLTADVLRWDRSALLHLLGAYIDGDGHVGRKGRNAGTLRIRSSSRSMLHALADVIRALGTPVTLNWDVKAGFMTSPTNGKAYLTTGSGCVSVTPDHVDDLIVHSRKNTTRKVKGVTRAFKHEGFHLVQVTEREDILLDEEVFNLEVEGPHDYTASEVVVHNCNKDPKRSLGRVEMAFFNAEMHRIELLLELRNELDKELIQRINDGEFPAVSMGCRVEWDVCLRCGHRAPTRKEYCHHALEMRAIDPATGEVNGVLNPTPKFFDISFVFRPADRTGFMLKKIAEDMYVVRGGASLGEKVSEYEEKRALARKLSDIQKELAGDVLAARVSPEATVARAYRQAVPLDHGPAVPDEDIDTLAEYPLPDVLSTLAEKGAALTASEFCRLFLKKVANVRPDAALLDRFVALHPVALETLGTYPSLAEKFASTVELSPRRVNNTIVEKLAGMGDWVRHRTHSQLGRPVGGPGYLTDAREAPRTDLLTMTDPNSGHLYTTTRGAAMVADRADSSATVGTALGLSGLYGMGLYGLGRAAGARLGLPAAAAGVGLGFATAPAVLRGMNAYRNPQYLTDQGVRVSGGTEFKMASLFDKLAADYAERVPEQERGKNNVSSLARRAKLSAVLENNEAEIVWRLFHAVEKTASDAVDPPTLDPGTFATVFGDILLNP